MKRYLLILAALAMASTATAAARNPRKSTRAARLEAAERAADSLRAVTARQAALIDSLQCLAVCPGEEEYAEETDAPEIDTRTPEEIAADSVADMRRRMERKEIHSTFETDDLTVIDTLSSGNDALYVVLFGDNSWKYVRNREVAKDSTIFEKYWDTKSLFPYSSVTKADIPESVVVTTAGPCKSLLA